jgi:hypothetical protein
VRQGLSGSTELGWIYRPDPRESRSLTEHAGKAVYAVGAADAEGRVAVTLTDGTRLQVRRHDLVTG